MQNTCITELTYKHVSELHPENQINLIKTEKNISHIVVIGQHFENFRVKLKINSFIFNLTTNQLFYNKIYFKIN